jgi:hypothetical protein
VKDEKRTKYVQSNDRLVDMVIWVKKKILNKKRLVCRKTISYSDFLLTFLKINFYERDNLLQIFELLLFLRKVKKHTGSLIFLLDLCVQ